MSRKIKEWSVITKEDVRVFDKPSKVKTRACVKTGDIVKCTAICTMCAYGLAELELKECKNEQKT